MSLSVQRYNNNCDIPKLSAKNVPIFFILKKRGDIVSPPFFCHCVMRGVSPVSLILVVAQVYSIVDFLAGGVEARDKHHLVAVAAAHDLVVNVLHIFA